MWQTCEKARKDSRQMETEVGGEVVPVYSIYMGDVHWACLFLWQSLTAGRVFLYCSQAFLTADEQRGGPRIRN